MFNIDIKSVIIQDSLESEQPTRGGGIREACCSCCTEASSVLVASSDDTNLGLYINWLIWLIGGSM